MLSVIWKFLIVIAIGFVFLLGMATTVYWSLRSPVVTVPDIVGKDRFEAETELQKAGLNFRIRAARPSRQVKPDTVMFQLPRAGESVKAGQTVAVDIARVAKEGEASETVVASDKENSSSNGNANSNDSANSSDSKPKRNRNTNANANSNSPNANSNANGANSNRNANATRTNANVKANSNAANSNAATPNRNLNSNRGAQPENGNANRPNRNAPAPARATPAATPARNH